MKISLIKVAAFDCKVALGIILFFNFLCSLRTYITETYVPDVDKLTLDSIVNSLFNFGHCWRLGDPEGQPKPRKRKGLADGEGNSEDMDEREDGISDQATPARRSHDRRRSRRGGRPTGHRRSKFTGRRRGKSTSRRHTEPMFLEESPAEQLEWVYTVSNWAAEAFHAQRASEHPGDPLTEGNVKQLELSQY